MMTTSARARRATAPLLAYLSFFTFGDVDAGGTATHNLIQVVSSAGEGVGVASYLLIGFITGKAERECPLLKALCRQPALAISPSCWRSFAIYLKVVSVALTTSLPPPPALAEMQDDLPVARWGCDEVIAFCCLWARWAKIAQLFLQHACPTRLEGPTPGVGLDPRSHDGHGGRVSCVPQMSPIMEFCAFGHHVCGVHWCPVDRILCRDRWPCGRTTSSA